MNFAEILSSSVKKDSKASQRPTQVWMRMLSSLLLLDICPGNRCQAMKNYTQARRIVTSRQSNKVPEWMCIRLSTLTLERRAGCTARTISAGKNYLLFFIF
jgi:hypothetical protein